MVTVCLALFRAAIVVLAVAVGDGCLDTDVRLHCHCRGDRSGQRKQENGQANDQHAGEVHFLHRNQYVQATSRSIVGSDLPRGNDADVTT